MSRAVLGVILGSALIVGCRHSPSFTNTMMGELRDEDGTHLAFTSWQAPDGWRCELIHNEFPSSVAAEEYLEKQTAKAVKVLKRGNIRDRNGKIVGKRVEVIFGTSGSNREGPAVLRTNGPQFYLVLSDSFRHILQVEKLNRSN
jgi:hypothetical protein